MEDKDLSGHGIENWRQVPHVSRGEGRFHHLSLFSVDFSWTKLELKLITMQFNLPPVLVRPSPKMILFVLFPIVG
jgi:hypothetical protein